MCKEEVEQRVCKEVEHRQAEEQWRLEMKRNRAEEQADKVELMQLDRWVLEDKEDEEEEETEQGEEVEVEQELPELAKEKEENGDESEEEEE